MHYGRARCPVPGASCSGAVGGSGRLDTPNALTLAPAPAPNSNQCLWWCHFGRCSGCWWSPCGAKARGGKLRLRKVPRGVIVQPQANGVTTGPVPGGPIEAAAQESQLTSNSLGALSGMKTQQQQAEEKEAAEKAARERSCHAAASKGDLAALTHLVEWGVDVNATDEASAATAATPIHLSAHPHRPHITVTPHPPPPRPSSRRPRPLRAAAHHTCKLWPYILRLWHMLMFICVAHPPPPPRPRA